MSIFKKIITRSGNPETYQSEDRLKAYRRLRKETSDLHLKVSDFMSSKKTVEQAAKALGLFEGKTIIMEDENDIAFIMDYSIYEAKVGTQVSIQYFYDYGPELSAKEDEYLENMLENRISLFEIIGFNPENYTVNLKNILYGDEVYTITDVAMSSKTDQIGALLFSRIFTFGNINMTGGAAMAFDSVDRAEIIKRLGLQQFTKRRKLSPAELYVFFYRTFRSIGATIHLEDNHSWIYYTTTT